MKVIARLAVFCLGALLLGVGVTYFLLRRVADGAFLMLPISEEDADDATRKRFCILSPETTCRISTPEQLFAFARATAEKEDPDAGIVVVEGPAKRP